MLRAPQGLPTRPTTDRAKEGLFSWMNSRLDMEGLAVMDLFCGTGNISYEFISRGAAKIVAVDKHPACVKFVREQFNQFEPGDFQVFCTDAKVAIERSKDTFDIVFADPPYDYKEHLYLANAVMNAGLLKPDGIFIMEHPAEINFKHHPGWLETRHYGRVYFSFFNFQS